MAINPKIQIAIYSGIFFIFFILSAYIYFDTKNYSCSGCVITFKSQTTYERWAGLGYTTSINITAGELYEGLKEGRCIIKWDTDQGYYKNG